MIAIGAALGLAAAVVTAVVVARECGRGGGGVKVVARDPARRVTRVATPVPGTAAARPTAPAAASWLVEPGVEPRRIAGIVLDGDAPAAGARVVLRSSVVTIAGEDAPTAMTGADGRFDFGPRVPTHYALVATLGATTSATEKLDLHDPLPEPAADELTLRLKPCEAVVRGRVRDVDGRPIPTAVITAMVRLDFALEPLIDTPVEPDGSFAVCRGHLLTARAPGYASATPIGQRSAKEWDVVLYEESVIEGVVLLRGEPVPAAWVSLGGDMSSFSTQSAWSEADGTFRITGVQPGPHQLHVDAAQGFLYFGPWVRARPGEAVTGVRLALEPRDRCRAIAGVVLDGDRPLPGVRVHTERWAWTQLDGSFVSPCGDIEAFDIAVEGHDVLEPRIPAGTGDLDDLVVRVTGRSSVSGRVTAGGQPVAEVQVALAADDDGPQPRARTGVDGRFTLTGVAADAYSITAWDKRTDRRSTPRAVTVVRGRDVTGVELTLDVAGAIEGVVVDRDGRPVPGVAVKVDNGAPALILPTHVAKHDDGTDADGRFSIGGLTAGTYQITVGLGGPRNRSYLPLDGDAWPAVVLTGDDGRATVRLAVRGRHGLSIRGRVVDDQRAPIHRAVVRALGPTATTDAAGRFELTGLMEGSTYLSARGPEGQRGSVTVAAGTTDVELVAPRTGTLRVMLRGGVDACTVSLLGAGEGRTTSGPTVAFEDLPAGTHEIVARCPGGGARSSVELAAAQTRDVELAVGAAGKVRIRARTADGAPAAGILCRSDLPEGVTDAAGLALLEEVTPGKTRIVCASAERPQPPRPILYADTMVDVVADATTDLEVTVAPLPAP